MLMTRLLKLCTNEDITDQQFKDIAVNLKSNTFARYLIKFGVLPDSFIKKYKDHIALEQARMRERDEPLADDVHDSVFTCGREYAMCILRDKCGTPIFHEVIHK